MELEEAKHILGMVAGRESGVTTVTLNRDAARVVLDALAVFEKVHAPTDDEREEITDEAIRIAHLDARQAAYRKEREDWFVDHEAEPEIASNAFFRGWDAAVDGRFRRSEVPEPNERGALISAAHEEADHRYGVTDWTDGPGSSPFRRVDRGKAGAFVDGVLWRVRLEWVMETEEELNRRGATSWDCEVCGNDPEDCECSGEAEKTCAMCGRTDIRAEDEPGDDNGTAWSGGGTSVICTACDPTKDVERLYRCTGPRGDTPRDLPSWLAADAHRERGCGEVQARWATPWKKWEGPRHDRIS